MHLATLYCFFLLSRFNSERYKSRNTSGSTVLLHHLFDFFPLGRRVINILSVSVCVVPRVLRSYASCCASTASTPIIHQYLLCRLRTGECVEISSAPLRCRPLGSSKKTRRDTTHSTTMMESENPPSATIRPFRIRAAWARIQLRREDYCLFNSIQIVFTFITVTLLLGSSGTLVQVESFSAKPIDPIIGKKNQLSITTKHRLDDDFVTLRRGGSIFSTLRPTNNPDSKPLKKRRATAIQQKKSLKQLPIETESSFMEASGIRATKIGFQPDPLTREQMLRHRLLTMEEETELGEAVHRGAQLTSRITQLMDEKAAAIESPLLNNYKESLDGKDLKSLSDLPYLMESQKLAASKKRESSSSQSDGGKTTHNGSFYYEQASSSLTDEEIINVLLLSGGRSEMLAILQKAKEARQTLITCNIKLVASIAKTWINRSKNNRNSVAQVYSFVGGWDLPSYDELLQEGILGLTRAVDKFDTTRKLRFSTYATYWIQSYIRRCLQVSATTCLRVPTGLHRFKVSDGDNFPFSGCIRAKDRVDSH